MGEGPGQPQTYALGVREVLLRLLVGLQLVSLVSDIDPFVFHDLLGGGGEERQR